MLVFARGGLTMDTHIDSRVGSVDAEVSQLWRRVN